MGHHDPILVSLVNIIESPNELRERGINLVFNAVITLCECRPVSIC